ncbi:hypothetical protein JCM5296_000734 [Sporobolomyces johnsonii]
MQLTERLSIRLQYACFKLQHSWTRHSLSEIENLYFQPFADQAQQRRKKRREDPKRAQRLERAIGEDLEREERERGAGRWDRWEGTQWYGPWRVESRTDREARMSAVALGKRKVEDSPQMDDTDPFNSDELHPILASPAASTPTLTFQPAPSTSAAPPYPVSRVPPPKPPLHDAPVPAADLLRRQNFPRRAPNFPIAMVVDDEPNPPSQAGIPNLDSLRYTTSELLCPATAGKPLVRTDTELHQPLSSSMSLLLESASCTSVPSPFSASSTSASSSTTLARASSASSFILPGPSSSQQMVATSEPSSSQNARPDPPVITSQPGSVPSSSQPTSSQNSSSRNLPLSSQASFSALPPVPPLPFGGLAPSPQTHPLVVDFPSSSFSQPKPSQSSEETSSSSPAPPSRHPLGPNGRPARRPPSELAGDAPLSDGDDDDEAGEVTLDLVPLSQETQIDSQETQFDLDALDRVYGT